MYFAFHIALYNTFPNELHFMRLLSIQRYVSTIYVKISFENSMELFSKKKQKSM